MANNELFYGLCDNLSLKVTQHFIDLLEIFVDYYCVVIGWLIRSNVSDVNIKVITSDTFIMSLIFLAWWERTNEGNSQCRRFRNIWRSSRQSYWSSTLRSSVLLISLKLIWTWTFSILNKWWILNLIVLWLTEVKFHFARFLYLDFIHEVVDDL